MWKYTVRHFCNFYSYLLYITQYNIVNSLYKYITVIPFAPWEFSVTSDPTYRDLLYFLELLYTTVFAITASLAPFYWGCLIFLISYIWIDTICPTLCLQRDWLHWMCYITYNDLKNRLSFMSETARALGVHLYVRNIPGHHFTVRIHCR